MNDSSATKDAYLTCSINGSQYILQTVPSSPEAFINIENLDEESLTLSPETDKAHFQNQKQFSEIKHEDQSEQTIPLICLDGQLYTLRDGQLQEISLASETLEETANQHESDFILVSESSEQTSEQTHEQTNVVFEQNFVENHATERFNKTNSTKSFNRQNLTENVCKTTENLIDNSMGGLKRNPSGNFKQNIVENFKTNVTENFKHNLTGNFKQNSPENLKNGLIVVKNHPETETTISLGLEDSSQLQEVEDLNSNDFLEVVTAFKCKICPYTSQDRSQLLQHFKKTHTTSRNETESSEEDVKLLYMCGECSNCFPSMDLCREHMINDHQLTETMGTNDNKNPVNSEEDPISLKNSKVNPEKGLKDVKNPKNTKRKIADTRERRVKCRHRGCLHKFSNDEMMQKHASCHIDSGNSSSSFKCPHCADAKFVKWKVCSMHLWKQHGVDVDLLSCEICRNYKASTLTKLSVHMRVHSDERDYECKDCGKKFKQSSQLRNHRVIHGDRKSADVQKWYSSRTCDICGKTYADSKCLKNHMQAVHSKLRPYVCNVCGHASARKAMLQMHLRQHTGDKPFSCDICEFRTGDHNSLRRHVMRHTGVRPYKCPHCSYSAIQSSCYKNHLKAKHPESSGLFTCDLCPFKTVKKETYLEHAGNHEKGLIKTANQKKEKETGVEVFPGNIAAAQLIYSCLGAFSKVGKTIEASLMSSSTSADGTSQTITIQIPSKHLEGSLPMAEGGSLKSSVVEQEDDETMHCFLKIPREEEENIDTGGITIPAEPEENETQILNVES